MSRCASRVIAAWAAASIVLTSVIASAEEPQEPSSPGAAAAWFAAYHRDSKLVRISGGRTLNLFCTGTGSPTVVLEAGIAESAFTWWPVQEKIAKQTRVCAYDRAGYGKSKPGPLPRDTRTEAAELKNLLRAARVKAPYVLVGHSMGGFNVRLFASLSQRDVAGLVLIDPSVEHLIPMGYKVAPAIAESDERSLSTLRACADPQRTAETAANCTRSAPDDFQPDLAAAFVSGYGLTYFQTLLAEAESFLTVNSDQVSCARRHFGAMPLVVLTRGERSGNLPADQAELEWKLVNGMHDEVAKLSSAGSNRVVPGANHYIHHDKPDVVVDAIAEVVEAARKNARRP